MSKGKDASKNKKELDRTQIIVAIVGVVGVIIAAYLGYLGTRVPTSATAEPTLAIFTMTPNMTSITNPPPPATLTMTTTTPCIETYPPLYGFECTISGWVHTALEESQAIKEVSRSQATTIAGVVTSVLEITVDFTGPKDIREAEFRESGEVQINLERIPPAGVPTFMDLNGKVITAQVWASAGSMGDPAHKNGFQLFVKDKNGLNCYGEWVNIEYEKTWFQISWYQHRAALCDEGFNSSAPEILGLKIALGDGTAIEYPENAFLTIYLDEIDWQDR